jgi:4-aminobutyrate--pyruvate transaminase
MGAGGAIIPPEGYFEKINAVLAKYDILFISDEVITGFGRTGKMFGTETYGLNADSISLAKQITSAYFPLSAVMMNDKIYDVLVDQSRKIGTFGHGNTYAGHPVGCAVAVKTLEIYQREKIVDHVNKVSPTFLRRLNKLAEHPLVGEARGVGLIGGAELVKDKQTKASFEAKKGVGAKAVAYALEEGFITRAMGDRLAFCPPLVISEAEIEEMFNRCERALDKTLNWAKAEGLLAA